MVAAAVDAYRTDEILQENKKRMDIWNSEMINQFFCGRIWESLNHPIFSWRFSNLSKNPREMEASNATMQRPNDHDLMTWQEVDKKQHSALDLAVLSGSVPAVRALKIYARLLEETYMFMLERIERERFIKTFEKRCGDVSTGEIVTSHSKNWKPKSNISYQPPQQHQPPHWPWPKPKKRARQFPRLRQEAYSFALGSPVESCRSPRGGSRGKKWPNNQQQEGFRLDSALFGLVSLTPDLYPPGNELSYPTEREKEKSSTQKYQKVWEYVCQFPERVLYNLQHVG